MPCFYRREGSFYLAGPYTKGPWSSEHQHGGPVAALLIGAFEVYGDDHDEYALSNFSCEFLRPVPLTAFSVQIEATRGKTVDRLVAHLVANEVTYARARCVRIRKAPLLVHESNPEAWVHALSSPEALAPTELNFFSDSPSYRDAIDLRYCDPAGWGPNDTTLWARLLVDVVETEPTSPLQRVAAIIDAESGLCPPVPVDAYTFLNPELTLHLERSTHGPWLGMQIRSRTNPSGQGLSSATLFDTRGVFGRSAQSLVVRPRDDRY